MANPEAMAKANEKRMNGLEKKLDAFEKEFRKSGDMSAVIKRVATLEAAVKALAVTAKSAGTGDSTSARELSDIKARLSDRERDIKDIQKSGSPDSAKKIANLEKRKAVLEKTLVALSGRTDREKKEMDAKIQKQIDEHKEINKKLIENAKLEGRLVTLEAMVKAALAR